MRFRVTSHRKGYCGRHEYDRIEEYGSLEECKRDMDRMFAGEEYTIQELPPFERDE